MKNNTTSEVCQHISTTLDKVPAFLRVFFEQKLSVFMISGPGLGKTAVAGQVAQAMNAELITMVASVRDRLDLGGLPFVHHGADGKVQARFAPMQMMASLSKEHNPDGPVTILYLNEAPHAPDSLQPVLYRLVNERAVEGLTLRDNVHILADGNPSSAVGSGRELQQPLRRRFMWLQVEASVSVWTKWANENGLDGRVISFLNNASFSGYFNNFDPKRRDRLTYATPASWHNLSRLLPGILSTFSEAADRAVAFAAVVGQEAGHAFAGYIAHIDSIPDVGAVLSDPEGATLPTKPDMLSLLVGGVINHVSADEKLKSLPSAIKLCEVLTRSREKTAYPEFGVFLFRSLAQRSPKMKQAIFKSAASKELLKAAQAEKELFEGVLAAA